MATEAPGKHSREGMATEAPDKHFRKGMPLRNVFCVIPMPIAGLVALFAAGCGRPVDEPSHTELVRRNTDPRAVEFLLDAQDAFDTGFYNAALVLADSAARWAPNLADIPFLRGRILMTMRQIEPARAAYEETLALDPDYPGVYFNLGNGAYMYGEPRKALTFYRQEQGMTETTDYWTQLGRAYADVGETDSARWAYERAILADSTHPTAYMWLGQLHEDAGSFEEALHYSGKGLALDPDNLNYTYLAGVQLLRSGDLEGAVERLTKVTEGIPWHYAAHYNLGQALAGLGQTDPGARYLALADTLLERQKEVERWVDLIKGNSHEPMLWVRYGEALHQAGRLDEAIEGLTVAFSLRPQWLEIQNNIANLLLASGDTLAALERYRALLRIEPTRSDFWLNLGTLHALTGDYGEARRAWETALRHDPNHAEARQYLAQLPSP